VTQNNGATVGAVTKRAVCTSWAASILDDYSASTAKKLLAMTPAERRAIKLRCGLTDVQMNDAGFDALLERLYRDAIVSATSTRPRTYTIDEPTDVIDFLRNQMHVPVIVSPRGRYALTIPDLAPAPALPESSRGERWYALLVERFAAWREKRRNRR
jgi:hypothetical protein